MRRKEKEVSSKHEIEAIIRKSLVCRLALSDGVFPYVVPLCFGYQSDTLYFHSAGEGQKVDILKKNNRVCFEFDIDTKVEPGKTACNWGMKYKSVIGFGKAFFVEDPDDKRKALDIIMGQYAEGSFDYAEETVDTTTVIKVEIESMTGKQAE